MSDLPPLNALRAFEAAGRNRSVSRAADELFVTHGAISKQLKLLEQHLGIELFDSVRGGLSLTSEGQALLDQLSKAFDNLSLAVRNVRRGEIVGRVKVICMPAFATYWLIPKLSRFVTRYADVTLTVTPPTDDDPFRDPSVDVAIMFGRPRWPHLNVRLLKQMELFPVCSPVLLSGENKIRRSSDLLRHVLLDDPENTHWIEWFSLIGNTSAKNARRLCFTDFNHNLAAARAGLGITLGDNVTTAEDLANGTLVRPLKEALRPQNNAYYILAPAGGVMSKPAQAFLEWLTTETTKNEMPPSSV